MLPATLQMPSLIPTRKNMNYYNERTRSLVDTPMNYYSGMTITPTQSIPMTASLPGSRYDAYAVAPLPTQPAAHAGHHHHSHTTASYLSTDPHHRVSTSSFPKQHRPSSGAWNTNDDQTLLGARASGQNWSQIQLNYFPTKTPNACRKRHERLIERNGSDGWDNVKMEQVAKEYMKLRKEIWAPLALKTGEKWNVIEQKCMSNGLKNLQGAARAAARRERLEADLPPIDPVNDDSSIPDIALDRVDDLDGEVSCSGAPPSPDRSTTSSGGAGSSSSASQNHSSNPSTHAYTGYPAMGGRSCVNSLTTSIGTAYGQQNCTQRGHHSQNAIPYMKAISRLLNVDMGINSIIDHRPGGQQ